MPEPPQTIDDLLRLVRASGLVDEQRLERFLEPWRGSSGPIPDALVTALVEGGLLTSWQLEQLRRGKHKGFILGKYRLLRHLGAGGMSHVYLAEHSTLHHKVAIKVLPSDRVDQSSYLARFEREAQASARLNHPNICRAFDLDSYGSTHFIVMEYIEGVDLYAKVKREGPLEVREAVDLVRQAALGLQYAHEEGLIHRDVKPANLMLDKRGTLKILDLGLALARDEDRSSLTREHDEKVLGTADYLAPEQARDSHLADRRSDIYALGCTLYYLLVGRAPFAAGSLAERIRAHMNQPAPNLLDQRPDVPTAIVELYFRMMEKHPEARQQTAQEVADALGNWLSGGSVPRARSEPPRRAAPRRGGDPVRSVESPAAPRRQAAAATVRTPSDSGPRDDRDVDQGSAVRPGGGDTVPTSATVHGVDRGAATQAGDESQILLSGLSLSPAGHGGFDSSGLPQIDVTTPRKSSGPSGSASSSRAAGGKGSGARGSTGPAAGSGSSSPGRDSAARAEPVVPLTERTLAGLPLLFWLLVGVGIAIAGVLLAKNLSAQRVKPKAAGGVSADRGEKGAIDRVLEESREKPKPVQPPKGSAPAAPSGPPGGKPDAKRDPKPEGRPEPKPASPAGAKPGGKPESKTDANPPESKPKAPPDAPAAPKPGTKTDAKSGAPQQPPAPKTAPDAAGPEATSRPGA